MNRLFPLLLLCVSPFLNAQQEKNLLVNGNESYNKGKYAEAEEKYKQSLIKKKNYTKANFNLGNALYRMEKYEEATGQFDAVLNNTNNKDTLSKVYHNLGNSYLKNKKYQEAVNAYKNSMKLNSYDEDTRYNLAYALKKLQEQKKQEQKNENDKQNKQDQQNNQQQQGQSKISKEQAEQMLKALMQNEKKIQDEKKQKEKNAKKAEVEKDW